MYSKRNPTPNPVTVQIDKINPFSTVFLKTITLERSGEEKTVCRLRLDSDSEVVSISYLPKKMVRSVGGRAWGF